MFTGHVPAARFPPDHAASRVAADGTAPLKPLREPVDLDQYRVRRQTRVVGTINEYRLVA
jgi:hypothetical protein